MWAHGKTTLRKTKAWIWGALMCCSVTPGFLGKLTSVSFACVCGSVTPDQPRLHEWKLLSVERPFVNKHGLQQVLVVLLSLLHVHCFGNCCFDFILSNEEVGGKLALCTPATCWRHAWDQLACGNPILPLGVTSSYNVRLSIEKLELGLTKEPLILGSRTSKKGMAEGTNLTPRFNHAYSRRSWLFQQVCQKQTWKNLLGIDWICFMSSCHLFQSCVVWAYNQSTLEHIFLIKKKKKVSKSFPEISI